ncbi:MAG: hypothetical protein COB53_10340 [Elusimicrobia bacterium]|nr:MAG: hypothetical protein COB53_10340 [Elusimicrobiota bacterium]
MIRFIADIGTYFFDALIAPHCVNDELTLFDEILLDIPQVAFAQTPALETAFFGFCLYNHGEQFFVLASVPPSTD